MTAAWIVGAFIIGLVFGLCIGLFNGRLMDEMGYKDDDDEDIDEVGGN